MSKPSAPIELGQSPLTDPRALGSSALFHAVLILLASLTVLNATMPLGGESTRPSALHRDRSRRQPRKSSSVSRRGGRRPR